MKTDSNLNLLENTKRFSKGHYVGNDKRQCNHAFLFLFLKVLNFFIKLSIKLYRWTCNRIVIFLTLKYKGMKLCWRKGVTPDGNLNPQEEMKRDRDAK